jgi:hypothetical protein
MLLLTVGGTARKVTSTSWHGGNGGLMVDVCNVSSDLAVLSLSLGDDNAGHVVEIKVVRLSSGAVVRDVHPPGIDLSGPTPRAVAGALTGVIGSPDGRLLALQPWTPMDGTTAGTAIVDTVSGREVGHVDGSVSAFSGDGATVFTDRGRADWRTGRLTTAPRDCCSGVVVVRPGSADAVVSVASGPPPTPDARGSTPSGPPPDILLLRGGGSTVRLACCGASILSG